jgi:hypothetical protein
MSSRSLSDIDGSRKLDTACDRIERASQCFDGHKQLNKVDTPWTQPVGFDPDELAHEQSLETRPGRQFIPIDEMSIKDCIPGGECVCGQCPPDPLTSLEMAEEDAVIQKIMAAWAREGPTEGLLLFINHVSEEYGPAFRKRLIHAGVVC